MCSTTVTSSHRGSTISMAWDNATTSTVLDAPPPISQTVLHANPMILNISDSSLLCVPIPPSLAPATPSHVPEPSTQDANRFFRVLDPPGTGVGHQERLLSFKEDGQEDRGKRTGKGRYLRGIHFQPLIFLTYRTIVGRIAGKLYRI